jgi:hypothetical protein
MLMLCQQRPPHSLAKSPSYSAGFRSWFCGISSDQGFESDQGAQGRRA